ncbi:MAG: hypothetical protein A2X13_01165 [Bacteroidetes bacterium GWC2_33_15]|nr:MAG: hypothetical protein A2X10_08460 [Bacteroidetes bacterium GWA2_33_15]OFX52096.1 MAG: hypothetical protein A2X13_01165 [Bacteroidetes bacterium GWC2_33_15]OFX64250.1 MAG: hypothetical protein A2X15_11985 [Bacteroidetes bacterium GWB2_32_14]OFX67655.1 MAG: hypothetical protein A2X14_05810 [Bacteroidetes bacterium GWD2_33_33]HAN19260.1 hypothetical protein [Bacteroidales bacterium]
MTTHSKTYYHIQRSGFERDIWHKGDCLRTSKTRYNAFYSGLLRDTVDKVNANGETIGLIKYSNLIFKKDINKNIKSQNNDFENLYYEFQDNSFEYENLANKLHWSLFQYLKWIREEIFELERIKIDNDLPSRKHCIWICTENDIQKWWDIFRDSAEKRIFELKLDDNKRVHKGNGTLIDTETFSIDEYQILAKKYWSGEISNSKEIEFSYEGSFEIIKEYKGINEIL